MQAKDIYHNTLIMNLKKDFMIQKLEDELNKSKYDLFRSSFNDEVITALTSIDESKAKDTIFMKKALAYLYRENLCKLKEKTYSGRNKEPITPSKKQVLEKLFNKRLEYIKDEQEKADRSKTFGKIIKNAIESINKMNSE